MAGQKAARYLSIEILKALGIIYLVFLHFIIFTYVNGADNELFFLYPQGAAIVRGAGYGGLHVLGFGLPFLAGVTFYLFLKNKNAGWREVLRRAFYLSFAGFLMNALAWGWQEVFVWDVLQFVALSMLVSFIILKGIPRPWHKGAFVGLGLMALFLSDQFPWLRWQDHYWYALIFGDPWGNNYWPFFPWFALFSAGILLGEVFEAGEARQFMFYGLAGLIFLGISFSVHKFFPVVPASGSPWGPALFKPSLFFVLGVMGFCLAALSSLEIFLRPRPAWREGLEKTPLKYYSRGILWIYIISTILGSAAISGFRYFFNPSFSQATFFMFAMIAVNLFLGYLIGRKMYVRSQE